AAFGGTDGLVRGCDWLRSRHRAALRRFAQFERDRRGAAPCLVRDPALADVRDFFHLCLGGDRAGALRSAGGRDRDRGGVLFRIFFRWLRAGLPWRVWQYDPDERDDERALPRRLASAVRRPALYLAAGLDLVRTQDRVCAVLLFVGPCHLPAVPL